MQTTLVFGLGLALLAQASAAAQELPRVFGRTLDFSFVDAPAMRGELLATGQDSVWIGLSSGQMVSVPLRRLSRVRVSESGIKAGGILIWAVVGGLVTGGALTGACGAVEDASCGGVLPATLVSWLLFGGIAAAITGSGHRSLVPDAKTLRPYARFPQGLPASFPHTGAQSLASPPGDSVMSALPRRDNRR
jgi:hypothetical protein